MMQIWQDGKPVSCWAKINQNYRPRRREENLIGPTWRPQRHHPQRPGKRPVHLCVHSALGVTPGRRKAASLWGRCHRHSCCRLLGFSFPAIWASQVDGRDWSSSSGASVWLMRSHPSMTLSPIRGDLRQTRVAWDSQSDRRANWWTPAKPNAAHHFDSERPENIMRRKTVFGSLGSFTLKLHPVDMHKLTRARTEHSCGQTGENTAMLHPSREQEQEVATHAKQLIVVYWLKCAAVSFAALPVVSCQVCDLDLGSLSYIVHLS